MRTFQKTITILGIAIFIACILLSFTGSISAFLIFLFIPGPLFSLSISVFKKASIKKKVFYFILSSLCYLLIVYSLSSYINSKNYFYLLILFASMSMTIIFQLIFDTIYNEPITFQYSFLKPGIIGILSALLPSLSIYILNRTTEVHTINWWDTICWVGMFLIFPIWYCIYGNYLVKIKKVSS